MSTSLANEGFRTVTATFIEAETLAEAEFQADRLAALLARTRAAEAEEPEPAPNPFTLATEQKAARKRQLGALLSGRVSQPRDARGRYEPGSFDGGARLPIPERRDPFRDHGELVGELARVRRIFGVSDF